MASVDIQRFTDEFVTQVKEEYDRFVFETVAPYCETVAKMEIKKADLEEALTVWKLYKEGATPSERKTGKWILCGDEDNGNAMYKCSLCFHSDIQAKSQVVPYCWWCGAKMEGADNEDSD